MTHNISYIDRVTRWARYAWTRSGTNTLGRRPRRLWGERHTGELLVTTTSGRRSLMIHSPLPSAYHCDFYPKHSNITRFGFYTVWAMRGNCKPCIYFIDSMKYFEILTCHLMIRSFICKFAKWMSALAPWFYVLKNLMPVYEKWTVWMAAAGLNVAQLNELFT